MTKTLRIVHYINQFFAGLGGEEHAEHPPERRAGPVGPGRALQQALGAEAEIVATLVCGDNYFSKAPDQAAEELIALVRDDRADVLIAGPAFDSGRYGMACGRMCVAAQDWLGIPAVTGLLPENPAVDVYAPYTYIVPTGNTAATLRAAVPSLTRLALKLGRGEPLGQPAAEGYLPRGLRRNVFVDETAARRAVRLLLRKVAGEPYESELRVPVYDRVRPAPPIGDLRQVTLAVGTEGGTVPLGNPDRLEHVRATHWHKYPVAGLPSLPAGQYESAHGGYDARFANADPNRMVPLDSLRELERAGMFARLDDYMYVTVGCGMPIARATEIGQSIAEEMKSKGIHGMIMTAT